jgi:hypothetical protein
MLITITKIKSCTTEATRWSIPTFHYRNWTSLKSSMHKAPGPDNCTAELIKWLDQDNWGKLLDTYNNILDSDVYPESLKLANVFSIFKRRCHQNAELPPYSTTYKLCTNYLLRWLKIVYCKLMNPGYKPVNLASDQRNPLHKPFL